MTKKPRIVSLLPSATEIVCRLGMQEYLVGRSHECDFPHDISHLPILTKPKLNPDESSEVIHQQVTKVLESAIAVYEVYADKLRELQPTHIVTQIQCDVCAVSMKDVEDIITSQFDIKPEIIPLNPRDIKSVYQDILRCASSLNVLETGNELVSSMKARMLSIAEDASISNTKPKIACIEWISPLMSGGNWIPEFVEMVGGNCLFGKKGEHSTWLTWDDFIASKPDIILVMPCGFSLQKVKEEIYLLTSHDLWHALPAVQNDQVYLCDGNQYFNRPGPRLVDSLEIMAEIIHPTNFQKQFENTGYVKCS